MFNSHMSMLCVYTSVQCIVDGKESERKLVFFMVSMEEVCRFKFFFFFFFGIHEPTARHGICKVRSVRGHDELNIGLGFVEKMPHYGPGHNARRSWSTLLDRLFDCGYAAIFVHLLYPCY